MIRLRNAGSDFTDAVYLDEMKIEVCDTLDVLTTSLVNIGANDLKIRLFPNPLELGQLLQLELQQPQNDLEIYINDIIGTLIQKINLQNVEANTLVTLPVNLTEPGIYIVSVKASAGIYSEKITVLK